MEPNYRNLLIRAKDAAHDHVPALPKANTLESWQDYEESLLGLESSEIASEEADSWDWVIYHSKALALCVDVPSHLLANAEQNLLDSGDSESQFLYGGLYGLASACAYHIVYAAICESVEELRDELLELVANQVENLSAEKGE